MGNVNYSNDYEEDCYECEEFVEFLNINTELELGSFDQVPNDEVSSKQTEIYNSHFNLKYETTEFSQNLCFKLSMIIATHIWDWKLYPAKTRC
jgi:hypothetical protein